MHNARYYIIYIAEDSLLFESVAMYTLACVFCIYQYDNSYIKIWVSEFMKGIRKIHQIVYFPTCMGLYKPCTKNCGNYGSRVYIALIYSYVRTNYRCSSIYSRKEVD